MARFWERCGRHIFEMEGVFWAHHKGGFYTSLPLQLRLDFELEEIRSILRRASIRGLRIPSQHRPGLPGGMYVARPGGYDLKAVNRKQRGHVTRGLEACEIRPVEKQELLDQGPALNLDTLERQGRQDERFLDPAAWVRFVEAVFLSPGMAVHGAFVEGRLANYIVSCREGAWLHLLYKMSCTALREHYPDHALDFALIQGADPGVEFISNGALSMMPNDGGDRYKRQLGYEVVPHNLCIHFHPRLSPILTSRLALPAARLACSVLRGNERLVYASRILEGAWLSRSGAAPEAS